MTAALLDPTVQYLPPALQAAGQEFAVYGCEFLPLPANTAPPRSLAFFEVEEDHAFLIVAANVLYTSNADAVIGPAQTTPIPALVTMGRRSSRQQIIQPTQLTQNDSPLDNWFGTGKSWKYWDYPVIVPPSDVWDVRMTNLEGVTRNYRLSFLGCRLYRARSIDPFAFCRKGW